MPSRRVRSPLALSLLLLPLAGSLDAQSGPRPKSCTAAEYRQFDFWIGEWEVTLPDGSPAGANRIERILDGCALKESWTGAGGGHGTSYNTYDAGRHRWHQTWVDDQGNLFVLEGTIADGRMTLEGETVDTSGRGQRHRIAWQQTAPGRVRQLWEMSSDGGTTWSTTFDGRYRKR
ncbi:MAG: hypothetical protein ABIQ49_09490 [Gemmatimonadales bacterium]